MELAWVIGGALIMLAVGVTIGIWMNNRDQQEQVDPRRRQNELLGDAMLQIEALFRPEVEHATEVRKKVERDDQGEGGADPEDERTVPTHFTLGANGLRPQKADPESHPEVH